MSRTNEVLTIPFVNGRANVPPGYTEKGIVTDASGNTYMLVVSNDSNITSQDQAIQDINNQSQKQEAYEAQKEKIKQESGGFVERAETQLENQPAGTTYGEATYSLRGNEVTQTMNTEGSYSKREEYRPVQKLALPNREVTFTNTKGNTQTVDTTTHQPVYFTEVNTNNDIANQRINERVLSNDIPSLGYNVTSDTAGFAAEVYNAFSGTTVKNGTLTYPIDVNEARIRAGSYTYETLYSYTHAGMTPEDVNNTRPLTVFEQSGLFAENSFLFKVSNALGLPFQPIQSQRFTELTNRETELRRIGSTNQAVKDSLITSNIVTTETKKTMLFMAVGGLMNVPTPIPEGYELTTMGGATYLMQSAPPSITPPSVTGGAGGMGFVNVNPVSSSFNNVLSGMRNGLITSAATSPASVTGVIAYNNEYGFPTDVPFEKRENNKNLVIRDVINDISFKFPSAYGDTIISGHEDKNINIHKVIFPGVNNFNNPSINPNINRNSVVNANENVHVNQFSNEYEYVNANANINPDINNFKFPALTLTLFKLPAGNGFFTPSVRINSGKGKPAYTPSLLGIVRGFKTRSPKKGYFTGLEIRPMIGNPYKKIKRRK